MVETKVDASELKGEGDAVKELADFLKDKTSADVTVDGQKITVKGEGEAVGKKYVKVLIKKFLHQHELKDTFRVIMDKDDTLKVNERRLYEEE
jgi:Ribosomal L22e protein family